jgi:hypothetical protein
MPSSSSRDTKTRDLPSPPNFNTTVHYSTGPHGAPQRTAGGHSVYHSGSQDTAMPLESLPAGASASRISILKAPTHHTTERRTVSKGAVLEKGGRSSTSQHPTSPSKTTSDLPSALFTKLTIRNSSFPSTSSPSEAASTARNSPRDLTSSSPSRSSISRKAPGKVDRKDGERKKSGVAEE